jgi:hypothetical protein
METRTLRYYKGTPDLLELTTNGKTFGYWLSVVGSDFGSGFSLKKCAGDGQETYFVHVWHDHLSDSCDCAGGTFKGKCKHQDAIRGLIQQGKLPAPPAPAKSTFIPSWDDCI